MQSKLLAALRCDGGKSWDEDENFNGFLGSETEPAPASRECQWNIL
jgi:hypothetical protein